MTESIPKRTNFRHTVQTSTPLGSIYRWVMSSVHRRYQMEQALSAFWLPIVYEELNGIAPEQLKRVASESVQALELQAQVLRHRYGIFPAPGSQTHVGVATSEIVTGVEQPSMAARKTTSEDYSEYLFEGELSELEDPTTEADAAAIS